MELVCLLKKDDVDAFDVLYHRYFQSIYRNVFKLTKDHVATQDLVQDVFTDLWDKRGTLDPDKPVAGWLFVSSYHKTVSALRKAFRESLLRVQRAEDLLVVKAPDEALAETQSALIYEAMRHLSPQKRKVFQLCKLEGKSYAETAEALSLSKHTVKEHLSGALSHIRKFVEQHPGYLSHLPDVSVLVLLCTDLVKQVS
jgi:RNA polymerase sigma-70 factor (ECF subfamily)